MAKIARIGDTLDHGGSVKTGAAFTFANNKAIARVGDIVECETHGVGVIITGSDTMVVEGAAAARVGDMCSCGAIIATGSDDVEAG